MASDRKLEHLAKVKMFSSLNRRELARVSKAANVVSVKSGTEIVTAGTMGEEFYMILSGKAAVRRSGRKVAELGPGDYFVAIRIAIGLAVSGIGLAVVGWRAWFLFRTGVDRQAGARAHARRAGAQLKAELLDVFAQRKLLRRSVPGLAHFFTFWGFIILFFTIIEAYGDLFSKTFAIPLIGQAGPRFLEDFFAVAILLALATFSIIRMRQEPGPTGAPRAGSTAPTPGPPGSRWP
jgi:hypothetical protein